MKPSYKRREITRTKRWKEKEKGKKILLLFEFLCLKKATP